MEDISLGNIKIEQLEDIIEKKYGKESKDNIFENLKILGAAEQQGYEETKFQAAINIQKEFLKCIEKDISNIKTKEQLDKYRVRYNYYKENNIVIMEENGQSITEQYFNTNKLDNMLLEKESIINENQNKR